MMNDLLPILYRNAAGELQVRLDDPLAQDLPPWPGQWSADDIHVVAQRLLVEELTEIAQMDFDQIRSLLRGGDYAVIRPAAGLGMQLDREQVLMCNAQAEIFFILNITKGWRDDGEPQLGIIGARRWPSERENRELLALRDDLARKDMEPQQYARWAQDVRTTIPKTALEWLIHKRDKVLIEGVDLQGRKLFIGILPYAFSTQTCQGFLRTDAFWSWLDDRIKDARNYATRTQGLDVSDFCIEDLVSLRLYTRREPVQYDFILWSRP